MARKAYLGIEGIAQKLLKLYVGVEKHYRILEYIESSGTQYINTGFKPKYNTRVIMDAEITGAAGQFLFGARDEASATAANQFVLYTTNEGEFRSDYFGTNESVTIADFTDRTVYDKNGATMTMFGTKIQNTAVTSGACSYPLFLFANNSAGTDHTFKAKLKLYSCKIYDNGTLIRDFVPCADENGTAGLYDVVNDVFYTDAAGGTFTSGAETGGKISAGGVARRIRKAYVGIGGVARPCWASGVLSFYGRITPLSAGRGSITGGSVGKYALFAGGLYSHKEVDAYRTSLTTIIPTQLSQGRYGMAAASVGNYVLFAGGTSGYTISNYVDAYDASLTRTNPTALTVARNSLSAVAVKNHVLFGGGSANTFLDCVDAYDASLTRTTPTVLGAPRYDLAAASVGDYALFAGGYNSSNEAAGFMVDTYDKSLTKGMAVNLSVPRDKLGAASVGDYALFAGGTRRLSSSSTEIFPTVDAYDSSLTKTSPTGMKTAKYGMEGVSVGGYALFGPGGPSTPIVDAYDEHLTRSNPDNAGYVRTGYGAASVGDYALFAGGTQTIDIVEAYTIA